MNNRSYFNVSEQPFGFLGGIKKPIVFHHQVQAKNLKLNL